MMTSFSIEEISRRLSHTLDCLGCSPEMVQHRNNYYNYYFDEVCHSNETHIVRNKTVGSRGEGLVKMYESDLDVLQLLNHVLAVEDDIVSERIPASLSVFHIVPCLTHPGHFKLLLIRQGNGICLPERFLNPFENGCWLSSKEFVSGMQGENITVSGPAQTQKFSYWNHDAVVSVPCFCPRIIQQWIQRPRQHDWPSSELKERISHMPTNIVATGQKGCPDEEIEWRICFNEIELLLVSSWNDTQRKLYKVLKMIKTDVFVSAGFGISSYIMKNIVLWFTETYQQSDFQTERLVSWILKSLRLLRKSVKVYNLPYYMIPERNLIAEKIPRAQCKSLSREISDLIDCGPQLLWECKKLEFAMSMTPNELLYYKDMCNKLEVLRWVSLIQSFNGVDTSNYDYQTVDLILNSHWPPTVTQILKDKTDVMEICRVFLG